MDNLIYKNEQSTSEIKEVTPATDQKNDNNKRDYKKYIIIFLILSMVAVGIGLGSTYVFNSEEELDFEPSQEVIDAEVEDIDKEIEELEKQIQELESEE